MLCLFTHRIASEISALNIGGGGAGGGGPVVNTTFSRIKSANHFPFLIFLNIHFQTSSRPPSAHASFSESFTQQQVSPVVVPVTIIFLFRAQFDFPQKLYNTI